MHIYYVAGVPYSDELYHYGILGQKWGIRRFQNSDGTLTDAGKARYGSSKSEGAFVRGVKRFGRHQIDKFKSKHPWMMSDEELNEKTQRAVKEKNYLQTLSDTKKLTKGKQVVSNILEKGAYTIGDKLFNKIGTNLATDKMDRENSKLRKMLDNRDLRDKLFNKDGDKGTIAKLTDIMNNPSKYSNSEIKDAAETLGKLSSGKKLVVSMGLEGGSSSSSTSDGSRKRVSLADLYVRKSASLPRSAPRVSDSRTTDTRSTESSGGRRTYTSKEYINYSNGKRRKLLYGPGGTAYR